MVTKNLPRETEILISALSGNNQARQELYTIYSQKIPGYQPVHQDFVLESMRVSIIRAEIDYEKRLKENPALVEPAEKDFLLTAKREYNSLSGRAHVSLEDSLNFL